MSTCSFEAVDALAFGELPPPRAAEVSEHVAACRMCELQLRRLKADRALLSGRARAVAPAFDLSAARRAVTARLAQREQRALARRRTFLAGALSAAALLLVTWLSPALRTPAHLSASGVHADLFMSLMDPSLACRSPVRWDDRAIFSVESRYGACLLATPRAAPDEAALCL